jgi:hypothetical protein
MLLAMLLSQHSAAHAPPSLSTAAHAHQGSFFLSAELLPAQQAQFWPGVTVPQLEPIMHLFWNCFWQVASPP